MCAQCLRCSFVSVIYNFSKNVLKKTFQIAWTPCLAAFSIGLQTSEDAEIILWCLQGFRLGIRVACLFRLALERNAYIQALAR